METVFGSEGGAPFPSVVPRAELTACACAGMGGWEVRGIKERPSSWHTQGDRRERGLLMKGVGRWDLYLKVVQKVLSGRTIFRFVNLRKVLGAVDAQVL